MPAIFPGMNPYLEHPQLWTGVHSRLIVYLADQLNPRIRPRYVAAIEERVYVEGGDRKVIPDAWIRQGRGPAIPQPENGGTAVATLPDTDEPEVVEATGLEIHETYIQILDLHSEKRVVTVIEVVSPSNKSAGDGRDSYLAKQAEVLASPAHLVEIDLLRRGQHVMAVPVGLARRKGEYDYLISVNRAGGRRQTHEFYRRTVRQRLPRIRIPLAEGDDDVRLDLQIEIEKVAELGGYEDRIDYRQPCVPHLSPADQIWADSLIEAALGRPSA